jgi:hypothetical protein
MQNTPSLLITAIILSLLLIAANGFCLASNPGPEEMELQTAAGTKPARFPHTKHQKTFGCKECHHAKNIKGIRSPYVEGMEVGKCSTCHNNDAMADARLNSFKLAAHALCKECHKKNKDSAPTRCTGCHIK